MGETLKELDRSEKLDWIRLIRTNSVGPVTFQRLLTRYGTAKDAIAALPDLAKTAGRKTLLKPPSREEAEYELNAAEQVGAKAVAMIEPDYPALLRTITDPPPILYGVGHLSLLEKPAVALVGARNASAAGRRIAGDFARDLGNAGYVVVSGLARGIDGAAHTNSLDNGTIAVVAGGVDVIYPPEHLELTRDIARRGLIVSERPPGAQPTARDFPRRNRLISGLSLAVVVIEAAMRSGTLITARTAADQGREVFAVPGSPLDPRCKGSNNLIRDGAGLAESAEDIIQSLSHRIDSVKENERDYFAALDSTPKGDTNETEEDIALQVKETIRELMSPTPIHRDEIIRASKAGPGLVADALLELVLAGEVIEEYGGFFAQKT
ncbi:MAG: DNA-processing protein DprA [Pseudomonadota bacterium]